jgi:AAHS family 4-hydroxybenzoate transporter-like MFS transporter
MNDATLDISALIDRSAISGFQKRIAFICFLFIMVDGFDVASVGFIAPALSAEFNVVPAGLAPLFASSFFGLLIGSLIAGPMADRRGRKPVLIGSLIFFGIASLAAGASGSLNVLVIARFLTGLGLGGAFPNAVTLASEYFPKRARSRMTVLAVTGFSLGSAIGGLVTAQLVGIIGWRGILEVGGALPLLLALVGIALLPESVKYLVARGENQKRILATLNRIATVPATVVVYSINETVEPKAPLRELLGPGLAAITLLLWLTFFMSQIVIYLITSWLPLLLMGMGTSIKTASLIVSLLQFFSVPGALVLGVFMDRTDARLALAAFFLVGALFVIGIGVSAQDLQWLVVSISGVGLSAGGSMIGLYALAAQTYPVNARATGVAWATSAGRVGAITASLGGGVMLAFGLSYTAIFVWVASATLIAAAALITMRLVQGPRSKAPNVTV